jgi:outer membrane receptor protein involved in Fe transport
MPRPVRLLILVLLFLPLAAVSARAQEKGSISGKASDKKTGHALPFATVTVVGAQRGALTDAEGVFQIGGIPAGTYEVKVQFLGYRPESRPGVVVTGGKATVVNFQLEDMVVREEKAIEVTAERRLVEVKQGTTVRSVNAGEIRNLPVQTIGEVLQQQAGVSTENDQIHVRGGRADETIFVVNGVANRDLVTGQSTAGQLNARSVAEINVATGAFDVRYGNALSGVVEVKLKEGGDHFDAGLTLTSGSYGGHAFQTVMGGPDPVFGKALHRLGLPGTFSSIVDVSGSLYETRFLNANDDHFVAGLFSNTFSPPSGTRLRSSYEDAFFGYHFHYGNAFTPSQDNRWAGRYALTWKPNTRDKVTGNFSKRIAIDQGFSRTFINATGDAGDPSFPWRWAHRLDHAPTIFEDNVQSSLEWRRTLSSSGFTTFQLSKYYFAQRQDVQGKMWWQYEEPDDRSLPPSQFAQRTDFFLDTGDDNTWQDRRTSTTGIQWSLVQRLRRHEIEVGLEHEFQTVQYVTIQNPWVYDPDGLGDAHDLWRVHPWVGDLYVRDKLEYEGFTANFGLRADYWMLGREVEQALADTANHNISTGTRNNFYDQTNSFFGRRYKMHISPRVIVAHPITENSSFFFNYGEFTQNPSYRYVYSKLTSISSESFPILGNPNLNPQVSVNYEVGAKHQFLPTAAVNATFFVKDVYDYPSATTFQRSQGTSLVDIFVYLNGHFARSKGFELQFEKRRSNNWSGKLTYTFQQTKGKSSDPNEQKVVEASGGDAGETRLSETFVNWNRPHKLAANFDLRFDEKGPERWGFLKNSGVNLYIQGQSGRPYTPVTLNSTQAAEPNSKNGLFQVTTDFRVNHMLKMSGRRLDLSLAGTNIFNNYIINRVDPMTGRGRIWGRGSYDFTNPQLNVDEFTKISAVDDPSNYGAGAQWRLSLDYDF